MAKCKCRDKQEEKNAKRVQAHFAGCFLGFSFCRCHPHSGVVACGLPSYLNLPLGRDMAIIQGRHLAERSSPHFLRTSWEVASQNQSRRRKGWQVRKQIWLAKSCRPETGRIQVQLGRQNWIPKNHPVQATAAKWCGHKMRARTFSSNSINSLRDEEQSYIFTNQTKMLETPESMWWTCQKMRAFWHIWLRDTK